MDKLYFVVSVGNTDNKLTQQDWNLFVGDLDRAIKNLGKVHFFGCPENWAPWQNVAWIVEAEARFEKPFTEHLKDIRKAYEQDSAFLMVGKARFV